MVRKKQTVTLPEPPRALNVAGYARVSSGKDAMLDSLSAQVSYYSKLIQEHPGWRYVGVYADEALTGTKDARPEFQRMLDDCRAGKIDIILVKALSRLARNTVTLLDTVRELKALCVDIWFEREGIHTMSAEGEVLLTLIAAAAQEESRSVSENCKWRLRKQYREGRASFHNAYGYRNVDGKPVIEEVQAEVVRFIFQRHNDGVGLASIARLLDEIGVPPPATKGWNPLTIRYILSNERYAGDLVLQKVFITDHLTKRRKRNEGELDQILVQGGFPAIVSREVFELAQRVSSERSARYTPTAVAEMSAKLSGMIICAKCGKPYKRKLAHGKAAWNCGTFMRRGKAHCHGKQIPEETLLEAVGDVIGDGVRVVVPGPNRLVIELADGQQIERVWADRSRSESWDEAARDKARQQTKERCV